MKKATAAVSPEEYRPLAMMIVELIRENAGEDVEGLLVALASLKVVEDSIKKTMKDHGIEINLTEVDLETLQ